MSRHGLLLLLSVLLLTALAIDAAEFGGQYRRAVWREASRQVQMLQYKVAYYLDPTRY
jgi:hypothetical protein